MNRRQSYAHGKILGKMIPYTLLLLLFVLMGVWGGGGETKEVNLCI